MALTALIAAYHESAEPGALRATLPLAGRTVVERQARLASAAGAAAVILLVERIPADLSAAVDRLRRDRLPVRFARSAEEAAEAVDPGDRLLLVADGAIIEADALAGLARDEDSAVLTVPDGPFGELYERIDGSSRWAGLAAIDGSLLKETAAMLRDWDLQSTLLRRALQAGARHIAADGAVAIVDAASDVATIERRILAAAETVRRGWAARLLAPLERGLARALMGGPVPAGAIGIGAVLLTGLGAAAFGYGWLYTGLALLLVATPLEGGAERLSRLRMQDGAHGSWWSYLMPVASGAALLALAYTLARDQGWGMVLLAFTTLAFLIAEAIETETKVPRGAVLLAERRGMAWLMLPFAAFGLWQAGLAILFAYAAGSFFWAQREAHSAG